MGPDEIRSTRIARDLHGMSQSNKNKRGDHFMLSINKNTDAFVFTLLEQGITTIRHFSEGSYLWVQPLLQSALPQNVFGHLLQVSSMYATSNQLYSGWIQTGYLTWNSGYSCTVY
eukprot:7349046-Ditylum_brightwellii.AAC.1